MQQLGAKLRREAAFVEPEILKIDKATIDKFVAQEPRLKTYKHYLDDIQRRAAHTLTDAEERLLAGASVVASAPSSDLQHLLERRLPLPDGDAQRRQDGQARLVGASASIAACPNRDDRKKVMTAFFGALGKFKGTFGTTLNGQVQSNMFYASARKYETALEASLDGPTSRPRSTSASSTASTRDLPTFHRYLQLRKKMMKLPDLHYYDLYAPLVASVDLSYTADEAQKIVLAALGAARARVRGRGAPRVQRAVDRSSAERRQAVRRLFERRRLRRPPVHADQLQRQVHGHEHGDARARPHDAELPVEQDAAVRHRRTTRSSSPRSPRPSTRRC